MLLTSTWSHWLFTITILNENWTINGPEGTRYAVSYSGWMADIIFEQWFRHSFVSFTADIQKLVVLFFDGHRPHLTYNTICLAMEEFIIIICLPPHTSHALQPLGVGVFGAYEVYLAANLTAILSRNEDDFCRQRIIPDTLKEALRTTNLRQASPRLWLVPVEEFFVKPL